MTSLQTHAPPTKRAKHASIADNRFHPAFASLLVPSPPFLFHQQFLQSLSTPCDTGNLTRMFARLSLEPNLEVASHTGKRKREVQKGDEVTAQDRVLGLAELRESIMSFLPPEDILGVQRLSHAFKDSYVASKQLQIKTFERVNSYTGYQMEVGNGYPPFDLYINSMLVKRAVIAPQGRARKFELHLPPGICKFNFDLGLAPEPCLFIRFEHDDGMWNHEHTGSWTKQFMFDPAFSTKLFVEYVETAIDEEDGAYESLRALAHVVVRQCPIGKMVDIAQKLHLAMACHDLKEFQEGDGCFNYPHGDEDWEEYLGAENVELMETKISFSVTTKVE